MIKTVKAVCNIEMYVKHCMVYFLHFCYVNYFLVETETLMFQLCL